MLCDYGPLSVLHIHNTVHGSMEKLQQDLELFLARGQVLQLEISLDPQSSVLTLQ